MKPERVIVLILNWNKPDDTIECIESCQKIDYDNYEILLVDNLSDDDSIPRIKACFPRLNILIAPGNLGYAGGNNLGIRQALSMGADYILLLNNDTTVDKNVLSELIVAVKSLPEAGIIAPKVLYYDDPGVINSLGTDIDWFRLRPKVGDCNQKDNASLSVPIQRSVLLGCGLFLPAKTLRRVGLMEDKFFIFHEEADWCYRCLRAGLKNWVVPSAVIYHKASKTMREFSVLTHYYSSRNFLLFAKRNATWTQKIAVTCGLMLFSVKHLLMCVFPKTGKDKKMASAFFLGIYDYWTNRMGICQRSF